MSVFPEGGAPEERLIQSAFVRGHAGPLLSELAKADEHGCWGNPLREAALLLGHEPSTPSMPLDSVAVRESRRANFLASSFRCRRALVSLDPLRAREALDAVRTFALEDRAAEALEAELLGTWLDVLVDPATLDEERFERLRGEARRNLMSAAVVEVAALSALWLLEQQDDRALSQARVAARMARTETLPQPASLANLVLARARRLSGGPYRSARILAALRRFSAPSWRRWIDWESVLSAGARVPIAADAAEAAAMAQLLDACAAGRQDAFERLCAGLETHPTQLVREDVGRFVSLVDPSPKQAPCAASESFRRGTISVVPYGLAGLCVTDGGGLGALAVATVGEHGVARLLNVAAPLLGSGGADVLMNQSPGQLRSLTAVAVLVMAGPRGLPEAELFRLTYGFAYDKALHRNAFNVMMHRARTLVGEHAVLDRRDDQVTLAQSHGLVVADPRCAFGLRDRLLRLVAITPNATARQIASDSNLPLRSVQAELKELVQEGVCVAAKRGRSVEYVVLDTTFHEPTDASLKVNT